MRSRAPPRERSRLWAARAQIPLSHLPRDHLVPTKSPLRFRRFRAPRPSHARSLLGPFRTIRFLSPSCRGHFPADPSRWKLAFARQPRHPCYGPQARVPRRRKFRCHSRGRAPQKILSPRALLGSPALVSSNVEDKPLFPESVVLALKAATRGPRAEARKQRVSAQPQSPGESATRARRTTAKTLRCPACTATVNLFLVVANWSGKRLRLDSASVAAGMGPVRASRHPSGVSDNVLSPIWQRRSWRAFPYFRDGRRCPGRCRLDSRRLRARGELSAAIELCRRFRPSPPTQRRGPKARSIAGWTPLSARRLRSRKDS
jgi:hypothetical protein